MRIQPPTFDLSLLRSIVALPFQFDDLIITLLDVIPAPHPGNWEVAKHRHPWFEFNVLTQGAFYTHFAEEEFYITAGQCLLIPPGVEHTHRFAATEGDDGFCLRWQLTTKGQWAEKSMDSYEPFMKTDATTARIQTVLSQPRPYAFPADTLRLFQFHEHPRPRSILAVQSLFAQWLFNLSDQFDEGTHTTLDYVKDPDQKIVKQTILFLEAYYPQPLKVEEIAVSLHISYRNLSRIFKRVTGCTIIEKLNELRINQAKKLLVETSKALKQIALEVGFDNEFYFSNVFRKQVYMSPSEFRRGVQMKS